MKSFNSGFVLFSPNDVDFDVLEYVCKMYIPNFSYLWFSEQFAWALLAARQPGCSKPRYYGRASPAFAQASRIEHEPAA